MAFCGWEGDTVFLGGAVSTDGNWALGCGYTTAYDVTGFSTQFPVMTYTKADGNHQFSQYFDLTNTAAINDLPTAFVACAISPDHNHVAAATNNRLHLVGLSKSGVMEGSTFFDGRTYEILPGGLVYLNDKTAIVTGHVYGTGDGNTSSCRKLFVMRLDLTSNAWDFYTEESGTCDMSHSAILFDGDLYVAYIQEGIHSGIMKFDKDDLSIFGKSLLRKCR